MGTGVLDAPPPPIPLSLSAASLVRKDSGDQPGLSYSQYPSYSCVTAGKVRSGSTRSSGDLVLILAKAGLGVFGGFGGPLEG